MICPECGMENPESANYCKHCGRSLTDGALKRLEQTGMKTRLTTFFKSLLKNKELSEKEKIRRLIIGTSAVCGFIALQPIPFADIFILSPIQLLMVLYMSKIKGFSFSLSEVKLMLVEVAGVVGMGVGAQQIVIGLYKTILPFAGGAFTVPLVFGATYAVGKVFDIYFTAIKKGENIDPGELKKQFKKFMSEGRGLGKNKAIDDFKKMFIKQAVANSKTTAELTKQLEKFKKDKKDLQAFIDNYLGKYNALEADLKQLKSGKTTDAVKIKTLSTQIKEKEEALSRLRNKLLKKEQEEILIYFQGAAIEKAFMDDLFRVFHEDKKTYLNLKKAILLSSENIKRFSGKKIELTRKVLEVHIPKDYRIYYKKDSGRLALLRVTKKSEQKKTIQWLIKNGY